jgi:hypothetical protein
MLVIKQTLTLPSIFSFVYIIQSHAFLAFVYLVIVGCKYLL